MAEQSIELIIGGKKVLLCGEDLPAVLAHRWWINQAGYAQTKIKRTTGERRTIGMHRLILGDPLGQDVDHINRDKLDNRRSNLRVCSRSVNAKNRRTAPNKSSLFRGVSKRGDAWQVVVRINGKPKWLGAFASEADAAKVAEPYFHGIAP